MGNPADTGLGGAAPRGDERDGPDGGADGDTERDAPRARRRVRVTGELRRQPAQREDEDDERHRLDEHLGDREVGRAVEDEEQRDAVAGRADEHDRREPASGDEHEHRGRDDDDARRRPARGCPRAAPSGIVPRVTAARPGQGDEDDEDAGEVDRERAALRHGGRLDRPAVDPPQRAGEAALAVDERRHAGLHAGDEVALGEENEPDGDRHEREHQRHGDAVPEGERLRLGTDGEATRHTGAATGTRAATGGRRAGRPRRAAAARARSRGGRP